MNKKRIFVIIFALLLMGSMNWPTFGNTFQFPSKIKFKLLKQDRPLGECTLLYNAKTNKNNISSLRLSNFQAMGYSTSEKFQTYFFSNTTNIYAIFSLDDKIIKSEIRLKNSESTFDLKRGEIFVYKEPQKPELQTEIFAEYKVIDLLSSFYVASKRVGENSHTKPEKYNFFFDKSTKIIDMIHLGTEQAPFDGKMVQTEILAITISNMEIFKIKIHKDPQGYCFPVSISIKDYRQNSNDTFELRADEITQN